MPTIATSNNPGAVFTTSSGAAVFSTTSTNTAYYPNIGNQFVYQGSDPTPFHINFSWDGKTVDVTLKNGNDIFKLANAFTKWIDKNKIEHSIKTSKRKK